MTRESHVTITMPIPPYDLSKNGRMDRRRWNQLYQEHRFLAVYQIKRATYYRAPHWSGPVCMIVRWYGKRAPFPDRDNAIARLAPIADAAEASGLIVNDSQIVDHQIDYAVDPHDPRLVVTFATQDAETT